MYPPLSIPRGWTSRLVMASSLTLAITQLNGCGCGFECNSDGGGSTLPGSLTLGISDAPLDDASEVVIVLDQIILRGSGTDDVTIDTFTVPALDAENADSIAIDLLQYPGLSQLLMLSDLEIVAGTYSAVELIILDGDLNQSYVIDDEGQKPLNTDASSLVLPGISIDSGVDHTYTIEISLGQSLAYVEAQSDYSLATDGTRVVENSTSASIGGSISTDLFSVGDVCAAKTDPLSGNRIYLYSGHGLNVDDLADVYNADSTTTIPTAAIAPFTQTKPFENSAFARWDYIVGYLPAGDYTLALSCAAVDDNPTDYNGLAIPSPATQVYEISLSEGASATCDLADGASCS